MDMEGEKRPGIAYSLLLLAGLLALVGLGLAGLPVTTAILLAFAAAVLGIGLYAAWEIAAGHRQAVARRRRRAAKTAAGVASAAAAPVPQPARLRSPA
jgi:hypothetical protein